MMILILLALIPMEKKVKKSKFIGTNFEHFYFERGGDFGEHFFR